MESYNTFKLCSTPAPHQKKTKWKRLGNNRAVSKTYWWKNLLRKEDTTDSEILFLSSLVQIKSGLQRQKLPVQFAYRFDTLRTIFKGNIPTTEYAKYFPMVYLVVSKLYTESPVNYCLEKSLVLLSNILHLSFRN